MLKPSLKLQYEGPIVLDILDMPVAYTILDPTHPSYRTTLCRDSLLDLGFTESDMLAAKEFNVTVVNSASSKIGLDILIDI